VAPKISIIGAGSSRTGLTGYLDLWAREGGGERMLLSKEFLQRLAGKKLRGFFFQNDRPYDRAEISATLEHGQLTFESLDISHTNLLGVKDLQVTVAPFHNRIALDHLLTAVREAATRGKAVGGGTEDTGEPPLEPQFQWRD